MKISLTGALITAAASLILSSASARAINGGTSRITTDSGWKAIEVISAGDNPAGGVDYFIPTTQDGTGAWLVDANTLRLQVNHEETDASISETDVNLANLQLAISNMISNGNTGGVAFVMAAQQAYDRWSSDGGSNWTNTSNNTTTSFYRFCSAQSYEPDTFGVDRGFVDHVFITGEEGGTNRLFVLESSTRDLYQLSGVTGNASGVLGGIGGMPFDAWENAALLDTGETQHVALVLSPDGGTQRLQLYIGIKGKDANGNNSSSFLARNGLAYGSYFYFNDALPTTTPSADGFFDAIAVAPLVSTKLEDIDTSPVDPTKFVLGDQDSGAFIFDTNLVFGGGTFNAGASSFSITRIDDPAGSADSHDNVDWTDSTNLGGTSYADGLVFVNEDNTTGEIWQMNPDGSNPVRVGQTTTGAESSGIFDLSGFMGYKPASILMTTSQGTPGSLTILIHPSAELVDVDAGAVNNDFGGDGKADVLLRNSATGEWFMAELNGLSILGQGVVSGPFLDVNHTIVSTGDFDGDGDADILTRGTASGTVPGRFRVELTNGRTHTGGAWMNTMSSSLNDAVMSTKDFDGDGKADVLLRNSATGAWTLNLMNGTGAPAVGALNASTDLCYSFRGDGDYDGNGLPDILLRRDQCGGSPYPWLVNTTDGDFTILASGVPTGVSGNTAWGAVVTDRDFNGDGRDDVLMRALTGSVQQWLLYDMNGVNAPSGSGLLNLAVQSMWQVASDADFNGDSKADIMIRSTDTGQWYAYVLNGRTITSSGVVNMLMDPAWQLKTIDDHNGDGRGDILLRDSVSGQWLMHLMDGVTVANKGTLQIIFSPLYALQNQN